jgi:restriction system protein
MGAIWLSRNELITWTSEIAGYKSVLALSLRRILRHASGESRDFLTGDRDAFLRIRSEEFEGLLAEVLYGVGNIPSPSLAPFAGRQYHRYKHDRKTLRAYADLVNNFHTHLNQALARSPAGVAHILEPIAIRSNEDLLNEWAVLGSMIHQDSAAAFDEAAFIPQAQQSHQQLGDEIARDLVADFHEQRHRNPWRMTRRVEWKDVADLEDLFKSARLSTSHGKFFDQRYVDYLAQNFDDIDKIHWRKFEGLTGEFFIRAGFSVLMGPGTNDGVVDLRATRETQDDPGSTILVQCKRQKEKIGKVVVKALLGRCHR